MKDTNQFMRYLLFGCILFIFANQSLADDQSVVCKDVGELVYGDQSVCQKGDLIIVNPMLAAYLCDITLPAIAGEKTVVCHYLGSKRKDRKK